jgi:hypothetical protein
MIKLLPPLFGLAMGISMIYFRRIIAVLIEKGYEKFPHYKYGAKTLGVSFKVRSVFILVLGVIYSLFSLFSLIGLIIWNGK